MRRRAQAEQIEYHRLVVPFPAEAEEAVLGLPAVGHRRAAVASPVPIRAAVERIGEFANFALIGAVAGEIRRGGQHARQQEGRVDRRKLAVPDAPPVDHV